MILCKVKIQLEPDRQWESERIADLLLTFLQRYEGFMGLKFAQSVDIGEYMVLSFWESEEQVLSAHRQFRPYAIEILGHQNKPMLELFDLYEPKTLDIPDNALRPH